MRIGAIQAELMQILEYKKVLRNVGREYRSMSNRYVSDISIRSFISKCLEKYEDATVVYDRNKSLTTATLTINRRV